MRVKEESEKTGLKLNTQKIKIMASSLITWWQIDGERAETEKDYIFLGSKITANCYWSHKIKRHLLLGRKAMARLNRVLKSRDITLPTEVPTVRAMVFSSCHIQMWELYHKESWVLNWCFWTVVLEKTLAVLDCKEMKAVNPKRNQCWIFIGRTDAEAETPILLVTWCNESPDSLEKTLLLGKIEDKRRSEQQKRIWLDSITDLADKIVNNLQETVEEGRAWCVAVYGVTKSQSWLRDWTTINVVQQLHSYIYIYIWKTGIQTKLVH